MKSRSKKSLAAVVIFFAIILLAGAYSTQNKSADSGKEKIEYGKTILKSALKDAGLEKEIGSGKINLSINPGLLPAGNRKSESYSINVDSVININGFDAAGTMYGCMDLANKIKLTGKMPEGLNIDESPEMKLRGVCILLMKLGTYNYPITPEGYPFFYNKKLWLRYLDFLAENRYNYVAFWNGHPFDYFVHLPKYPETEDSLGTKIIQENHDMLKWLIREGAKRNIKFFFEFYNIHTSVYYQKAHNLPDEISKPTKELADYTSYCIQKFVNEFPEVGLYITAGEALDKKYSVSWVNDVILKAIKETGKNPTVFLRSWFLKLNDAKKIIGNYPDLYIESKYNVEMVADTLVDPMTKDWSALNGNLIINIHMAGNLEPFRWNSPLYMQKCIQSSEEAGADGLHLYPRKSWRWPNGSEIGLNQYQWQRDELWFAMWGRYAWNSHRSQNGEVKYWEQYLAKKFGSEEAAKHFVRAFRNEADVLPSVQRLFWAGNDNHTVLTAGLMLTQIEIAPGIPFLSLNPVQRIPEFLNDLANNKHTSKISPVKFLEEKINSAEQAYKELKSALRYSKIDKKEAENYLFDSKATELTIKFYHAKLRAAVYHTLYKAGINTKVNSKKFLEELKNSVDIYRALTKLTDGHYDSISDVPASKPVPLKMTPYHWKNILPLYEKEYQVYLEDITQKANPSNNIPAYKGLLGVLFGDPGLAKPKKILNANNLEFDWDSNPPDDGRNWSVLFNGFIKAPASGKIKFYVSSKQSVILGIGGRKILEKNANPVQSSAAINMIKDKWYPLSIDYENVDFKGSNLVVMWSWNGEQPKNIDPEFLKYSEYNLKKANRALVLGF